MVVPCVIGEMEVSTILSCPFDATETKFGGADASPALPISPDREQNPKALRQP
jgi:hypothetical protein